MFANNNLCDLVRNHNFNCDICNADNIKSEKIIKDIIRHIMIDDYIYVEICSTKGFTTALRWLYCSNNYDEHYIINALNLSCLNGHLETAIVSYMLLNFPRIEETTFYGCCEKGYLDILKWIYEKRIPINDQCANVIPQTLPLSTNTNIYPFSPIHTQLLIKLACSEGHLNLLKWINDLGVDLRIHGNSPMVWCCEKGHIELVEWLISELSANICADNYKAVIVCCANGHIDLLKWLIKNIDTISSNKDKWVNQAFEAACIGGHYYLAKMLSIYRNNKSQLILMPEVFNCICFNGHFEIAKWLLNIHPNLIDYKNLNDAFVSCCSTNNLELAELLIYYGNGIIDFNYQNNRALTMCCMNDCLYMAKWLFNRMSNTNDIDIEHLMYLSINHNHIEVNKWLEMII